MSNYLIVQFQAGEESDEVLEGLRPFLKVYGLVLIESSLAGHNQFLTGKTAIVMAAPPAYRHCHLCVTSCKTSCQSYPLTTLIGNSNFRFNYCMESNQSERIKGSEKKIKSNCKLQNQLTQKYSNLILRLNGYGTLDATQRINTLTQNAAQQAKLLPSSLI